MCTSLMRKKKRGKKTDTKIQNKRGKNGEIKKTNKYSLLWSKNSAIELHYSPQLKYKIQTKI